MNSAPGALMAPGAFCVEAQEATQISVSNAVSGSEAVIFPVSQRRSRLSLIHLRAARPKCPAVTRHQRSPRSRTAKRARWHAQHRGQRIALCELTTRGRGHYLRLEDWLSESADQFLSTRAESGLVLICVLKKRVIPMFTSEFVPASSMPAVQMVRQRRS